jgi:hypothetical protein
MGTCNLFPQDSGEIDKRLRDNYFSRRFLCGCNVQKIISIPGLGLIRSLFMEVTGEEAGPGIWERIVVHFY